MSPNVVVITVDALRHDRVGALGGRDLTPNIDTIADDAAVFTNAFSTTNVTDVAVTSLQTGRYPLSHGIINHGTHVSEEEKKIVEKVEQTPEILSKSGYNTAKFGRPLGRWHRKGFDLYPSSMDDSSIEYRPAFDEENKKTHSTKKRFGNKLENIHPTLRVIASNLYQYGNQLISEPPTKSKVISKYENREDSIQTKFREFITNRNPFYSFIHLMNTHATYDANPKLVESYLNDFDYRVDVPMCRTGSHPASFDDLVTSGEYPDIRAKYYINDTPTTAITDAHYDAAVTEADRRIGNIIENMKQAGVYEESLIIILSDHGESLTEHGIYYDHHGLYDVSIRIPLIIRPPGGIDITVDELVQITDIAPTIASYTNTDSVDPDGVSLKPVIEDSKKIDRQYVLAQEAHAQRRRAIRSKDYKLIRAVNKDTICRYCDVEHSKRTELYDMSEDIYECNNIEKEMPEVRKNMSEMMDNLAEEFTRRRPEPTGRNDLNYVDDEEVIEKRLDALGYK